MPTSQTISTYYEITSAGPGGDDENLYIRVEITKGSLALSGASEAQILGFVRNYLQSLTENPINVTRVQTIRTEGL